MRVEINKILCANILENPPFFLNFKKLFKRTELKLKEFLHYKVILLYIISLIGNSLKSSVNLSDFKFYIAEIC